MDATEQFAAAVAPDGRDGPVEVDRAAMLIAAIVRSQADLDIEAELARLDDIAAAVRAPTLDGLRRTLFDDLEFRGNRDAYYDPRNSCLDEVLRTRRGIPITLSVVAMSVGRRCGVPLDGVGMPGHFLVRDKVLRTVFVDPFDGGTVLDPSGCEALFRRVTGGRVRFEAEFLEPVDGRAILDRMLANLTAIHLRDGDVDALTRVTRARLRIPGVGLDVADAAVTALAAVGSWHRAAEMVEDAVQHRGPDASPEAVDEYRHRATGLWARLN